MGERRGRSFRQDFLKNEIPLTTATSVRSYRLRVSWQPGFDSYINQINMLQRIDIIFSNLHDRQSLKANKFGFNLGLHKIILLHFW